MNLHPYLTPDLLTLIRTAEPKEIAKRFERCYGKNGDNEENRLGFRVEVNRSGGLRMGMRFPLKIEGFSFSAGYKGLNRRVKLNTAGDWRESFIIRFNEVLHDCEKRLAATTARQDANREREQIVSARKKAVSPLVEPLPASCAWLCENCYSNGIAENLRIKTASFTPEQIAQIVNLVRSFQP
jgi:hypothetical protein